MEEIETQSEEVQNSNEKQSQKDQSQELESTQLSPAKDSKSDPEKNNVSSAEVGKVKDGGSTSPSKFHPKSVYLKRLMFFCAISIPVMAFYLLSLYVANFIISRLEWCVFRKWRIHPCNSLPFSSPTKNCKKDFF
jgi:hypothetical protein